MEMARTLTLAAAVLGLGLAGCGGGGDAADGGEASNPGGGQGAGDRPTPPHPGGGGASVAGADAARGRGTVIAIGESQYGTILFDGDRRAIYVFDAEEGPRPRCYGDCATAWPPVLAKGDPRPGDGVVDASLIGTTERDDGATQVTYDGHPLYYYRPDPPGEVLCQNVEEFGGLWLVVRPSGEPVS